MILLVSSACSCIIDRMYVDPYAAALFLSACSTNPFVYVYTAAAAATTSLCPLDFQPWRRQTGVSERGRHTAVTEREREESGETSARAASHSEELTRFTYFLCLDFWFPFFIL